MAFATAARAGPPAGSSARPRASLDGHQIRGPMSRTSAGTSTERTTNVSSRTPKAIAKPSSVRNTSGSTASTENVAGQHDAGRRDDPAGDRQAAQHPSRVPCASASSRTRAIRKML